MWRQKTVDVEFDVSSFPSQGSRALSLTGQGALDMRLAYFHQHCHCFIISHVEHCARLAELCS
jgi:hypothetical protein